MLGIVFETNSCKSQTGFLASFWPCPKWNWADSWEQTESSPFQIHHRSFIKTDIANQKLFATPLQGKYNDWTGSTLLYLRWSSRSNNDKSVSLYGKRWTYHGNTRCVTNMCVSAHYLSHAPPSSLSPSLLYLNFTFKELESHLFIRK